MFNKIHRVAPKAKEPDYEKWAEAIRLMRERDGHSLAEIHAVFDAANEDPFWALNIMSPDKLRKQFSRLHAQLVANRKSEAPRPHYE